MLSTNSQTALGVVVAKAACENFEVWQQVCFKLLQKGSFDRLFESVRVCRNTFSTKLMQQCIQVTSLPWQLRVFYFLYVPWAPRRLWRQLADVFVSITITSNLSLISNITSPVATEVHIWYLLHFWKHTLPSNQETRTFKPLELMPSCLAHDLLEANRNTRVQGGWSSAAPGKTLYGVVFFAFFCNTFSLQVFLDVLPPKVIRWIGPKKDLKTRHGVSQQWSKNKILWSPTLWIFLPHNDSHMAGLLLGPPFH